MALTLAFSYHSGWLLLSLIERLHAVVSVLWQGMTHKAFSLGIFLMKWETVPFSQPAVDNDVVGHPSRLQRKT